MPTTRWRDATSDELFDDEETGCIFEIRLNDAWSSVALVVEEDADVWIATTDTAALQLDDGPEFDSEKQYPTQQAARQAVERWAARALPIEVGAGLLLRRLTDEYFRIESPDDLFAVDLGPGELGVLAERCRQFAEE